MATEPFDWSEYQKLADELARRPEESCLRTAIGRAYYYVFHLAKKRVEANGFYIIRGADTHKQVWEKYNNSLEFDCKKLGEIANRLKEKRLRADYEEHYARIADDLQIVLTEARDFAARIARLHPRFPVNTGVQR